MLYFHITFGVFTFSGGVEVLQFNYQAFTIHLRVIYKNVRRG